MKPADPHATRTSSGTRRRDQLLAAAVTGLTLAGIAGAVMRPPWLLIFLQTAVERAGTAAPLMYVLLCALAAPLHLSGLLVALSSLLWPLPVALSLSFVGSLLGSVLTAALLMRVGGAALQHQERWPRWLRRLSAHVARRPLAVGLVARIAIGCGMALEAFYVLTGYTRRQYLIVTTLGIAVWATQALVGVTVLHTLIQLSPWLAIAAVVAPALLLGSMLALRLKHTDAL